MVYFRIERIERDFFFRECSGLGQKGGGAAGCGRCGNVCTHGTKQRAVGGVSGEEDWNKYLPGVCRFLIVSPDFS